MKGSSHLHDAARSAVGWEKTRMSSHGDVVRDLGWSRSAQEG